jgi:UDP-glucuronate decarboxylase
VKHLVTGAAGFIGSHLCDRLLAEGDEVIALDNLFTGSRANLPAGVEFIRADVCDPLPHLEVDRIWNLACPASPVHYAKNQVRTVKTCVQGTINCLELAREVGARVLLASTSEVYGDPRVHPQTEDYWGHVNPIGPRACYDEGKRAAETLAVAWAAQYATDVRIARIFNTYGPRMASGDGRLIPNFITQALAGKPLTVYGDGKQTRSLCYVDDTVSGLIALMECKAIYKPMPVNIGNPDERTIESIALDVAAACGVEATIERKPLPADDPRQRCPDIARARKYLGWEPRVSYAEGLRRTVDWFQAARERRLTDVFGAASAPVPEAVRHLVASGGEAAE